MNRKSFWTIRRKGFGFKVRFGTAWEDDMTRADVFITVSILGMGLVFSIMGAMLLTVLSVISIANHQVFPLLLYVGAFVILICGLLCVMAWGHFKIHMDGEDTFVFRNTWGRKRKFRFDEISQVKQIMGNTVLWVGDTKISIPEEISVISQKFADRLDQRVLELYK